jgi:hypothetical protein
MDFRHSAGASGISRIQIPHEAPNNLGGTIIFIPSAVT